MFVLYYQDFCSVTLRTNDPNRIELALMSALTWFWRWSKTSWSCHQSGTGVRVLCCIIKEGLHLFDSIVCWPWCLHWLSTSRFWPMETWIMNGWAMSGCPVWVCPSTAPTSWSHWWTLACWTTWPRKNWGASWKWWTASTGLMERPSSLLPPTACLRKYNW